MFFIEIFSNNFHIFIENRLFYCNLYCETCVGSEQSLIWCQFILRWICNEFLQFVGIFLQNKFYWGNCDEIAHLFGEVFFEVGFDHKWNLFFWNLQSFANVSVGMILSLMTWREGCKWSLFPFAKVLNL